MLLIKPFIGVINYTRHQPNSNISSRTYTLDSSNYIVNNFGGLELKRFGITLGKLTKQTSSDSIDIK